MRAESGELGAGDEGDAGEPVVVEVGPTVVGTAWQTDNSNGLLVVADEDEGSWEWRVRSWE